MNKKSLVKAFLKGVPLDMIAEAFTNLLLSETEFKPKVAEALRGLAKAILDKVDEN